MRLGPKECSILAAAQFDANAPVAELRRRTGLREHVIHYHLKRLQEARVIRPVALIDVYRLGYTQYEIYFSLASATKDVREKLLRHLEQSPRIAWFAELGGNYQYALTLCASSIKEVSDFLDDIAKRYGGVFFGKSIAVMVSFTLFRKKYLSSASAKYSPGALSFGETAERSPFDDTDRKILSALFREGLHSHREMSRTAGVPRSTLEYRLRKLEKSGVVLAYLYFINAASLSMHTFKLLIYIKGLREGVRQHLLRFGLKHPNIVNFTYCIGSWDYEFTVEVPDPRQIVGITQEIFKAFGADINNIEILPVFRQAQSSNFMSWEKHGDG